jgi:hypothetical protein
MLYKAIGEYEIKALARDEPVRIASVTSYRCQPWRFLIGRVQVDGCYMAGTYRRVQPPMHCSTKVEYIHLGELWQMPLDEFPATKTHPLGY